MLVRITATPRERELDGVRLDHFVVGNVLDVSASIGTWLIAQGYALPEMRTSARRDEERRDSIVKNFRTSANDRRRRR